MNIKEELQRAWEETPPQEEIEIAQESSDVKRPFVYGYLSAIRRSVLSNGQILESKPDRRAELLDLASRLIIADRSNPPKNSILSSREQLSMAISFATSIIAEVDRVSGDVKS